MIEEVCSQHSPGAEERVMPEWAEVEVGTDDLQDACRGHPVAPSDLSASVVAVWHPEQMVWVFLILHSLGYGFASAVNHFNRLPTLVVAGVRRCLGILSAAYFDDLPTLDLCAARRDRCASGYCATRRGTRTYVGPPPLFPRGGTSRVSDPPPFVSP